MLTSLPHEDGLERGISLSRMIQPQKKGSRKETRQSELQEVAVKMISIVTAKIRDRIFDFLREFITETSLKLKDRWWAMKRTQNRPSCPQSKLRHGHSREIVHSRWPTKQGQRAILHTYHAECIQDLRRATNTDERRAYVDRQR